MIKIHIRAAQIEDAPEIVKLIKALATHSGETTPITDIYVKEYLEASSSSILLAVYEGKIIGLIDYSIRKDLYHAANSCMIEELIVHQAYRRQGVGSAMLKKIISMLADLKCAEISVTTKMENSEAIAFYKRHGLVDESLLLECHMENE